MNDTTEEKLVCESCRDPAKEAKLIVNPYIQDVWNETQEEVMCDECYDRAVDDI